MKSYPDQGSKKRSMFIIFAPCCLGSTISSQVAARYELVQTPFCLRGRNTWNFRDLCDFTVRSSNAGCIPEGPSNQSLNLISCWYHPAPVRVFGVTEKDHAASAVRLVAGPRCSSRQPSLCRWSRFLQHSQPLVLLLGLFASLEFHSKFFLSLRNQNLSWQASVWPEKYWQGPVFDTQELKELKTSASMYLYVWTVFPWLFLVLYLFFVFVDVWTRTLPGNWIVFSELRKLHATTSSRGNQKH